jgi:predicted ATPase
MAIKKIRVKNFKSFKDLELNLGKVNIFIGANGSGKSNFVDIIRLLKDISNHGLENAISMHGGTDYIRNVNIGLDMPFIIEIMYSEGIGFPLETTNKPYGLLEPQETIYTFAIEFKENASKFIVTEDRLLSKYKLYKEKGHDISEYGGKTEIEILISNANGKLDINIDPPTLSVKVTDIPLKFLDEVKIPDKSIMLHHLLPIKHYLLPLISNSSIYDFNPKLFKEAVPIFVKSDLEENGSNLVIFIKKILDDPEKKRMFMNLVSYLLPYIEDIEVDKFTETHFYLRIKETYSDKHYLPAPLISDGTINALGLIVALYFQESPLVIIEEPDKGFHPSLISKVVDMMKEAAEYGNKQIIVTTHNPVMVKHADPEDVFLVSRDKDGFSQICKPTDKKEIKVFLENEMVLADLYESSLLEI